jgi:hypothetical protein
VSRRCKSNTACRCSMHATSRCGRSATTRRSHRLARSHTTPDSEARTGLPLPDAGPSVPPGTNAMARHHAPHVAMRASADPGGGPRCTAVGVRTRHVVCPGKCCGPSTSGRTPAVHGQGTSRRQVDRRAAARQLQSPARQAGKQAAAGHVRSCPKRMTLGPLLSPHAPICCGWRGSGPESLDRERRPLAPHWRPSLRELCLVVHDGFAPQFRRHQQARGDPVHVRQLVRDTLVAVDAGRLLGQQLAHVDLGRALGLLGQGPFSTRGRASACGTWQAVQKQQRGKRRPASGRRGLHSA